MNEQQLRDEIAQLQTALGIKNGTIEQLKARLAELEAQQTPARQVPEGWRELAKQSLEALTLFTGHDSGANLRHRYGDKWWEPLDQLRKKLRAMLAAAPKESPHD